MAAKTAQKRGPKPKDRSIIKVPVTVWVLSKHRETAQVACDRVASKYR